MSDRNLFSNLRSPLAKNDEYGVTELLREVSKRNSSLSDEERKEVSEMVKRVEQHNAKPSPMDKMKKKFAELSVVNDMGSNNRTTKNSTVGESDDNGDDPRADKSVKKFANDLFQKFSNMDTISAGQPKDPVFDGNRGKEFFRSLSMKGIQSPLKMTNSASTEQQTPSRAEGDRRPEILKAFEQSSQSGKELLRNLSKKIQSPLSSVPNKDPPPSAAETAAAVSEAFRDIQKIHSPNIADLPQKEAIDISNEDQKKNATNLNSIQTPTIVDFPEEE
ncbi:unnamed protein product [Pseudo-nitzschia multistriata]|uniref:Uncharacterized protein n=1 Tax=Pseudo-nitzschia multistriata TaxID=183589 RepID=A0A448Z2F4_9STRA|nr:unnamed protein product [Pseudo-nitzschia multistriata]